MSGSIQLLSTPGTYSSRKTLLNASKDCRIKQKIRTYDTEVKMDFTVIARKRPEASFIGTKLSLFMNRYFSHAKLDL